MAREGGNMREITADANLVAYCGLYCGACGSYLKERCQGCVTNEKASWCKVRACCKQKAIQSCAECGEFPDPKACTKFNNMMSRLFGLIFRSDRRACIMQIKDLGIEEHAGRMAGLKRQSIRR
jgi:hypothetical protein